MLRVHARNNGRRLSDVARDVIDGTLHPESDLVRSRRSDLGLRRRFGLATGPDVTDPAV